MISFLLLLLVLLLLLFLRKAICHKTQLITETERNSKKCNKKTPHNIISDYFSLQLEWYLKQKYPDMTHWEYEETGVERNHYRSPQNRVRIFLSSGEILCPVIFTQDMLGTLPETNEEEPKEKVPVTLSPVQEWLSKHAGDIEEKVNAAMKNGRVMISYPLSGISHELMEEIPEVLMKNTSYSVFLDNNNLKIDFQALVPIELEA